MGPMGPMGMAMTRRKRGENGNRTVPVKKQKKLMTHCSVMQISPQYIYNKHVQEYQSTCREAIAMKLLAGAIRVIRPLGIVGLSAAAAALYRPSVNLSAAARHTHASMAD
jgi:hypothetical protein